MKITTFEYGVTVNKGNFENIKLSIRADVEEGENSKEVLVKLKNAVHKETGYGR